MRVDLTELSNLLYARGFSSHHLAAPGLTLLGDWAHMTVAARSETVLEEACISVSACRISACGEVLLLRAKELGVYCRTMLHRRWEWKCGSVVVPLGGLTPRRRAAVSGRVVFLLFSHHHSYITSKTYHPTCLHSSPRITITSQGTVKYLTKFQNEKEYYRAVSHAFPVLRLLTES
jgi:hypothetical protein